MHSQHQSKKGVDISEPRTCSVIKGITGAGEFMLLAMDGQACGRAAAQ